jgi:hypothetical protein
MQLLIKNMKKQMILKKLKKKIERVLDDQASFA